MESKDWDSYLQKILGEYESIGDSHWEDLDSKLNGDTPDADDLSVPNDESLRNSLTEYQPIGEVTGWEQLASRLDKADSAFDAEVADKVKHYKAPNNPDAWPLFLKHFSTYKALRIKLIAFKIVEASAVLLLLFTVFQMNQKGSFPLFDKQTNKAANPQIPGQSTDQLFADLLTSSSTNTNTNPPDVPSNQISSARQIEQNAKELSSAHAGYSVKQQSNNTYNTRISITSTLPTPFVGISASTGSESNIHISGISHVSAVERNRLAANQVSFITEPLASKTIDYKTKPARVVPYPIYVKPVNKGHLEFGMLAHVDFNTLKMPQDILYTSKKQFVFPLQGISSSGYGAGFTLGIAHERWAVESGLIYNTKTFKPGRQLTVGEGSDNSSVAFEAMQIQLISMPIQIRYKIIPQNRFKLYAIAGLGMHIIAQSDIDVDVNYNFNSLPVGENPNNHPALAKTIRESQRLSDNFRRKAPFSTKSYVSANLGLGIEYAVADRKTLFLQTTYQYQIPNLRFSNHNGKHLVSTSIQAGVRTPLGF